MTTLMGGHMARVATSARGPAIRQPMSVTTRPLGPGAAWAMA